MTRKFVGLSSSVANLADVKENVLKYLDVVARSNAIQNDSFNSWNGISELQLSIMDLNPSNFTRPQRVNTTTVENGTLKEVPFEDVQMDAQSSVSSIQSVPEPVHPKPKEFFISVSTAVYDRTINTTRANKGILLGVVGVDVPIEDVRSVLRGWKTGPLSHFFCANNNGFVQFHPHYRPMHGSQVKRYYDNVDIDELEQPLDFVLDTNTALPFYNSTLRTMLIDRQTDSVLLEALENPEDFLWALPMEKKIFATPLAETPFSCGVSMRWYRNTTRGYPIPKFDTSSIRRHWNIRAPSMKVLNPQLTNPAESCEVDTSLPYGAKLSPVKFCKFGNDLLHIFTRDPICALKEVLLDSKSRKENKCDEQHIAEIFVDAQATSSIYNHWKNLEGQAVINMFGIQQVFSMHQPGLIRFYNFTQPTYVNFLKEHEAGVEDALYSSTVLRSTFYENYKMLVFSPPPRQVFRFFLEKDISVPMTVTTVVSHPAVESVPLAVSGAQITYQKLVELFYSIVNSCRGSGCLRCNDTGVHCYITTENGQIIVSTQGEKAVNRNLKELDCALMEALVEARVMQEREFYDFQAICIEAVIPEINFASRLFSPLNRIVQLLWGFFIEFLFFWTKTSLFHLQSSANSQANVWHDLPHLSGGLEDYPTLNPVEKPNSENAPYAYGSQSRDESDFGFANQLRQDRTENDPMLPPAFYGDYEVLKLTDTPQEPRFLQEKPNLPTKNKGDSNNFKGRRPNVSKGPKPAVTTPLGETTSSTEMNEFAFPFGGGAAEGYNFNEPDDPWLMQQQAFSELNACFINEPTLVLGKSPASMPSVSAGTEETTMDMGTMFSEKEDIQLRGVPGLNNTVVNYTKPAKTVSRGPIVPGSLLRCIQRVVQMRCHAAGHSSNIIGRQACEVMCEAVRQRMSQLIAFLHDCRQPLDSCTQRYSVFFLNREAYAGTQVSEAKHGPKTYGKKYQKKTERSKPMGRETPQLQPKIHSGTYCLACGNADWVVSSIPDSNLLLVVTAMASEGAAVNCNCGCMRRYRYGTRVKGGEAFPRPQTYRAEPPSPATCQMVSYQVENAVLCANAASRFSNGLLLLGRLSGLLLFLALF
uniref:Voltage-dependent calcium channel alpha-2/delta subunit conserved region domain-containing protein n=1 Tax=Schistocephalus solidus TaxID=70667 RepID=A0A0V0JB06_SCHSO